MSKRAAPVAAIAAAATLFASSVFAAPSARKSSGLPHFPHTTHLGSPGLGLPRDIRHAGPAPVCRNTAGIQCPPGGSYLANWNDSDRIGNLHFRVQQSFDPLDLDNGEARPPPPHY